MRKKADDILRGIEGMPLSEKIHAHNVRAEFRDQHLNLFGKCASTDLSEAALLHDTVEDGYLTLCEIARDTSPETAVLVHHMTNVFTTSAYELLSRQMRKSLEVTRLSHLSPALRLLKLCDRLDNVRRIRYKDGVDSLFLSMYARESRDLLLALGEGLPLTLRDKLDGAITDLTLYAQHLREVSR